MAVSPLKSRQFQKEELYLQSRTLIGMTEAIAGVAELVVPAEVAIDQEEFDLVKAQVIVVGWAKARNIVQVIVVGSREEVALEKALKDIVDVAEVAIETLVDVAKVVVDVAEVLTEDPVGLVEAEAEA